MTKRQVTQCPVCDSSLKVTELTCSACETRLHGLFPPPPLARLASEQQQFIETFVRCRGIIRDVERALGISYPTVRARLDAAVAALEAEIAGDRPIVEPPIPLNGRAAPADTRRRDLLLRVEAGELQPEEAARALNKLRRKH